MNPDKCYSFVCLDVFASGEITPVAGLLDWIAINRGDISVRVNNVFLLPRPAIGLSGESFAVDANEDELWNARLTVQFDAGGTQQWLQLVQRFRTNTF